MIYEKKASFNLFKSFIDNSIINQMKAMSMNRSIIDSDWLLVESFIVFKSADSGLI